MFKTKILILGPCQSGKSTIANYLSDATEIIASEYRPTQSVRIVEFESNDVEINGKSIDAEVELWDCSGDRRFEHCWPAIQKDANGVIFVCNPDNPAHGKELEQWYSTFVARQGVKHEHTLVFLHSKPDAAAKQDFKLPVTMAGIQIVETNIEQDGEALRLEFNNFLCNVIAGVSEKRDHDEADITG